MAIANRIASMPHFCAAVGLLVVAGQPSSQQVGQSSGRMISSGSASCAAPTLVSHRGYRGGGAENTLRGFQSALEAGADWVELDVHFTKDHHPVLMHDATVDRTTTGSGRVSDMTLARFRRLRTTDGQRPPTLAAALRVIRARAGHVLVELKQVPDAQDLRTLRLEYRRLNAYRWASLMSFSTSAMRVVRSIPAKKGLLSNSPPRISLARKFAFVGVRYDSLTRARVRAYRRAGLVIYAWTPNNDIAWHRLAAYGVTSIGTDRTGAYLSWIRSACGV